MPIFRRCLLSACILLAFSSAILRAQTPAQQPAPVLAAAPDPANPNRQFTRVATPSGVAISPDGNSLAWILRGRDGAAIHLTTLADPDPAKEKLVTPNGASGCSVESPIWSPDSQTLAFLSTCTAKEEKPGQEQIFLYSRRDASVKQITHLTGNLDQPAWSPDGKSIAFLFVENATRQAGALDAMKPFAGVIGEDGIEVQTIGIIEGVDKGSNIVDKLTVFPVRPPLHVFEFSWAPDSRQIVFIGAAPPGENNWWIAQLYTVQTPGRESDSASVYSPHVVFDPNTTPTALHGLQIAVPRFSPDGKQIAFIGGLMSDQGSTGGNIWVVPSNGKGAPADVTPAIDGTPTFLAWLTNDTLGFVEDRRGHTLLTDYSITTRQRDATTDLGPVNLSGGSIKNAISVSNHGLLAFTLSGYNKPPELYTLNGSTSALTQITHLNTAAPKATTRFESVEWVNPRAPGSTDAFHVQGWLTYPKDYNPAKKYPMIVQVHGGPSASAGPRPDTLFSDAGYFVLSPNPRGSFGQGEAFVQANVKDFGYGDLRDILAGVDFLEKTLPIDDHRLGLTGWSYGGFMTMFAVTQTHRFRAAVAGAGISDWLSYYGENSIDQWMTPFFGASVYDDPAVYARSSAITYIKNVTTPTLVIVGDRDGECPAPQSFEFWHALRAEGVKTQLVVYPNEGHGFRDPAHIRDRSTRTLKWFADNMPMAAK